MLVESLLQLWELVGYASLQGRNRVHSILQVRWKVSWSWCVGIIIFPCWFFLCDAREENIMHLWDCWGWLGAFWLLCVWAECRACVLDVSEALGFCVVNCRRWCLCGHVAADVGIAVTGNGAWGYRARSTLVSRLRWCQCGFGIGRRAIGSIWDCRFSASKQSVSLFCPKNYQWYTVKGYFSCRLCLKFWIYLCCISCMLIHDVLTRDVSFRDNADGLDLTAYLVWY